MFHLWLCNGGTLNKPSDIREKISHRFFLYFYLVDSIVLFVSWEFVLFLLKFVSSFFILSLWSLLMLLFDRKKDKSFTLVPRPPHLCFTVNLRENCLWKMKKRRKLIKKMLIWIQFLRICTYKIQSIWLNKKARNVGINQICNFALLALSLCPVTCG